MSVSPQINFLLWGWAKEDVCH